MHILADKITNRLVYTLDFVFKSRGIDYVLLTDLTEFNTCTGPKISYSSQLIEPQFIAPCSLLFEEGISNPTIEKSAFENVECLSFNGISDPIATVFHVLTRYEEYASSQKDEHGRFPFEASVLHRFGWIEQCICDRIAQEIIGFSGLEIESKKSNPTIVPTFDIDNTYAYKWKQGKRKFLSVCKDLVRFDIARLRERMEVTKGRKDPYDTFDQIKEIAKQNEHVKLFWLVGDSAEKDRNISIEHQGHQLLIQEMCAVAEVNLHPSYASNGKQNTIDREKKRLEQVTGKAIQCSRQHFLRFQLPTTYRSLIACGFMHEYSMGFAEHVGFRAGTARSHHWFDVETNEKTSLIIHPFAYMDGTLNEYMKLSISESIEKIKQLYDEVAIYGGDFVFIWHNETIGDYKHWNGWGEVLKSSLTLKYE